MSRSFQFLVTPATVAQVRTLGADIPDQLPVVEYDEESSADSMLVCMRAVSDVPIMPLSHREQCSSCGYPVWVSAVSPPARRVCRECLIFMVERG